MASRNSTIPKNEQLLWSIIQSVNLTHINWDRVAKDLEITKNAASLRWNAYKRKLLKDSPVVSRSSRGTPRKNVAAAKKFPTFSPNGVKNPAGRGAGKRKRKDESEDEEESEMDDESENSDGFEGDGADSNGDDEVQVNNEVKDAPAAKNVRYSPPRIAKRSLNFAELESDNEGEDEEHRDEQRGHQENGNDYEDDGKVYEDAEEV